MAKFIFSFKDGSKEMKNILGGKGANLAEMNKIGLPVPHGFTISTKACIDYYHNDESIDFIKTELESHLLELEAETNKKMGDVSNPLLVSVRSGAVISMPGMMDTVLNLGLNDETVKGLINLTKNPKFAYDCYRRFIQMFSDVVLHIDKYKFDNIYTKYEDYNEDNLIEIIGKYKKLVKKETRNDFPQNVHVQLNMAIKAVFDSWNNPRAIIYRDVHNIPDELGTGVTVQSMVFGNSGNTSGTGVAFTRNPSTGENKVYGEYLLNAQGEDVVAGIRTPHTIEMLKDELPEVYDEFMNVTDVLESHYKDMQDIEFTIENNKLYLLQTRTGKRTAAAAFQIAVDMVDEKVIDKKEAILRIDPEQIDQLLHPTFDFEAIKTAEFLTSGLPASPGAATGKIYFDSDAVKEAMANGEKTILVRTETSPEDIEGMLNAEGILTSRGGMTSHAAVVARGIGKCCIAGCVEAKVEEHNKKVIIGSRVLNEGDEISLDGTSGNVYGGSIETTSSHLSETFETVMGWADDYRELGIRANADNRDDALTALKFGAEGIGLCRTEHMFFEESRIKEVRKLILAKDYEGRVKALDKLLPYQKNDFYELFKVMENKPVIIRLLDPPLHEFLPKEDSEINKLAEELGTSSNEIKKIIEDINEINPMLGHRGCRLGITYPEIYRMQVMAIFQAIVELDMPVSPEVMIPLVGFENELKILKKLVIETADKVLADNNVKCDYKVGTMIEVPRAALTADEIAKDAEFFSFGTNDLTQMTLGFSRDDSGKFITEYKKKSVFKRDPFQSIDQLGVGKLMKMATDLGRETKKDLHVGICGEHGGEPDSIEFCHKIGLNYVSCSPFRVPIARLSAAQAAIKNNK